MATYFHGSNSEIQSSAPDGSLQTLYLMNPNYVPYSSDAAHHPTHNMLLFSPNTTATPPAPAHALNLANLSHAPPQQHMFGVTIPASNILGSTNPEHEISSFHGFATTAGAAAAPRVHYNLWGSIIDQTPSSAATPSSSSGGGAATGDVSPQMGFQRHGHQQGLSLSLSSQQQTVYNRSLSGDLSAISPTSRGGGDDMRSVILGSKYLKAVQELLDEVVNVGKGIYKDESMERANKEKMKANRESTSGNGEGSSGGGKNGTEGKQVAELSTAHRQELQLKKSKLVSMLDEVEQRYRQYHHQMQIVISSFEEAASTGAAKSYTALALKTISKQFRCLKDAISSQIKATSKTLGEDDCLGARLEGSRLRYVDHHLQQQRALQQLGMVQHNAWRPQRGLPERAVSVLRAWLFEHFLHPYPKDSDKVLLAKQTGLTRSQVSNWFINARVRLWKPMVEEMYLEEIKEQEHNNDSSLQDNTNNNKSKESKAAKESGANIRLDQIKLLQSKAESNYNHQNTSPTEISNSSLSTSPNMGGGSLQSHSAGNFHLADSSSNKPRIISSDQMHKSPGSILSSVDMERKHGGTIREANNTTKFGIEIERHSKDGYPLMTINENNGGDSTYGAFTMEDIGRFNVSTQQLLAPRFHGNGVSLSLGLPHSENNLPLSGGTGTQHGFLSQNIHLGMRLEMGGANGNEFCAINTTPPPSNSHSGTGTYEGIDIQNRKRFAAQLLPDFVA